MKKFKDIYEFKVAQSANDFYKGMPIDPVGTGVDEKAVLAIFKEFGAEQEYPAYYDKRNRTVTFTSFENTGMGMVRLDNSALKRIDSALKKIKGAFYIDFKDKRCYVSAQTTKKIDDSDKVEV